MLKKLVFNPRIPGPMAVVASIGDTDYYVYRAKEELEYYMNTADAEHLIAAGRCIVLALERDEAFSKQENQET